MTFCSETKALCHSRTQRITKHLPTAFKAQLWLYGWSLRKIPMILWVSPRITELSAERCTVRVPLTARTRNHHGSLYFGAYCIGAELAVGMLAQFFIRKIEQRTHQRASLFFTDFQATFHKASHTPTYFVCTDGARMQRFLDKVQTSHERASLTTSVIACADSQRQAPPLASFTLTASVRMRPPPAHACSPAS